MSPRGSFRSFACPLPLAACAALATLLPAQVMPVTPATPWPAGAGGNGHSYQVFYQAGGISWSDANAYAASVGGHLATITSAAENLFVFGLVMTVASPALWTTIPSSPGTYGPWLGARRGNGWRWVTGEPFDYANWDPGEPNDACTGWPEEYLHYGTSALSPNDLWNDFPDGGCPFLVTPNAFVVEYPLADRAILVPAEQHLVNAGFSGATWRSVPFRFQMVYDSSLFLQEGVTGPITIRRLRFRGEDGEINAGGQVYPHVVVQMSSSPLDHLALSTTFAANQGADLTTVYRGPLTVMPSTGDVPNSYNIDIVLAPPFVYDPTLGLDLNIEVDANAAPSLAAEQILMATSSNAVVHRGRRLAAAASGAATGTLSDFASVCMIHYTGTGGYVPVPVPARVVSFASGCNARASSFYEAFVPERGEGFDLASNGLGALLLTPAGPDNYVVAAIPDPIVPPMGVPNTADDGIVQVALPFPFPFPGGSTNVISACTNGFVWLGANTNADWTPTLPEFLGQMPRLAPVWHDFHCGRNTVTHAGSGMYVEIDASNPADVQARVTWDRIGEFNTVAAGGHSVNTFQCVLHADGRVRFRYGAMACGDAGLKITGFSRGFGASDPGPADLSHITRQPPFFSTTGPDLAGWAPLFLDSVTPADVVTRPILGTVLTLRTRNVQPTVLATINFLSLGNENPPVELTGLGAPGCRLAIELGSAVGTVLLGGPDVFRTFAVPASRAFNGVELFSQSAALDLTANPLGFVLSNGLKLTVGAP
jgi:hypothetical protein